ncbi:MAG: helix-turn-helix domain-containing protein [Desulfovibrio sp.]|nr:helix-turn-helix domain-containing protein [Desulfovibrio sp.]
MDGREVDESLAKFGANLKTARLRRGLSQAGVAAMAGVSQRTLQKLEGGDPGIALRTAGAVMKALGFGLPFDGLCSPETDEEGRRYDEARMPKRGRRRRRFGTVDVDGAGGEDDAGDSVEEPAGPSM